MKMTGSKIKYALWSMITCVLLFAAVVFSLAFSARAENVLEGDDDVFVLTDARYEKDEKFAFSATAEFEHGSAAGLVFGATEDLSYWVFNVDRAANAVKLMYFDYSSGEKTVHVIDSEYYVGTELMNDGEKEYVASRTATIGKVYLKVVITPVGDSVFAEFYADGIRRFAYVDGSEEAVKLDLNAVTVGEGDDAKTLSYEGGRLGYNCFNANVRFVDEEIGETDYSNYAEIYRNQYHFSQFAHWNNDPNGLVYYKGYYHLYFQHNPYGNTWDTMHWGHARSRDLVHWELLPIALVPDRDLSMEGDIDHGIGAMWSGSARVYHKGDSDKIDNEYLWFGDVSDKSVGGALGLIGFYTRFDGRGNRHQIVMYSTDGGLSWNKRDNIDSSTSLDLNGNPVQGGSWRDPKVFDISDLPGIADGYKWGMALTDMEDNMLFFLKSKNLVEWEHAGVYEVYRPECPDVVFVSDGNRERAVITFTSRYYIVCDLSYENGMIVMRDDGGNKITTLLRDNPRLKKMDYGVDSYAAQTFYIDDDSDSAYAGKNVGLSWFSGVPNAAESIESGVLQTARKVWNGGGMTIPVMYGLEGETLTTTPITVEDGEFQKLKTSLVDIYYSPMADGIFDGINSRTAEIKATLSNPSRTGVAFKVNMNADGSRYTEIGWNKREGYYVDRTHTDDGGIAFPQPNYAKRYASGMGKTNVVLDFYILVDRNNVEVYCDGFTVPFYVLTFADPHSSRMSFESESDLNIIELKVNAMGTVWRDSAAESVLYISDTDIELDTTLTPEKEVTVVSDGKPSYEIVSGGECVELAATSSGFTVKALSAGNAVIKVNSGEAFKLVDVTVHSGAANSDLTFSAEGVVSGKWLVSGDCIIGEQPGGDGFILAREECADFIYSATFDLGTGAAAALVFRATAEDSADGLDRYIIVNYDDPGKVVKLWSDSTPEIARASFTPTDIHNISLTAIVEGNAVKVFIDGKEVINATLGENEPKSGRLGLNACATRATFKSVKIVYDEYEYADGALEIGLGGNTRVDKIINGTFKNTEIPAGFYTVIGSALMINEEYFSVLPSTGEYDLRVAGDKFSFEVTVRVESIPQCDIGYITVTGGNDASVFIGKRTTEYVKINGIAIASAYYDVTGYTLKIKSSALGAGDNTVELSDGTVFIVSVMSTEQETISIYIPPVPLDYTAFGIGFGIVLGVVVICVIALVIVAALAKKGKLALPSPYSDRTAAIRRRNFGLIAAACVSGPIALVLLVSALTAPIGNVALWVLFAIALLFGYPYTAQLVWHGKLYNKTLAPIKTSGTVKEIFDVDKEGNKFKVAMRYCLAALKTVWLGIKIFFCGLVSLIRAPFLFAGQLKAVTYGEFGYSNKADSIEKRDESDNDGGIATEGEV